MHTSASSSSKLATKFALQFGVEGTKIRQYFCPNLAWYKLKDAMVKLRCMKQQTDARNCFVAAKVYVPYTCPLCGNYEQENFIEAKFEGDVICNGVNGEGCGLVMVERAIDHSPVLEYDGDEIRGHHGSANMKHISEASNLSTKLLRTGYQKQGSFKFKDIKKVHNNVTEQYSTYGKEKENKDTRREYKEQQIRQAEIVFSDACRELPLSERVQSIALDYFAAFRLLKKQIRDVGKWRAACLLLGLEEVNQFESQVVERVLATPPSNQAVKRIKLAPPHKTRPQWNPPPPPSKKRKTSCLFHSSPKQVQRGDCIVHKEGSRRGKRSSDYFDAMKMKKSRLDFRRCLCHMASPIVGALMNEKFGFLFEEPVDPVKLKLPDYFDIIQNPMDLGTVQTKLNELDYQSIEHFAADVRLVFNNCMKYNNAGSELFHLAQGMLGKFEIMLAKASSSFKF